MGLGLCVVSRFKVFKSYNRGPPRLRYESTEQVVCLRDSAYVLEHGNREDHHQSSDSQSADQQRSIVEKGGYITRDGCRHKVTSFTSATGHRGRDSGLKVRIYSRSKDKKRLLTIRRQKRYPALGWEIRHPFPTYFYPARDHQDF